MNTDSNNAQEPEQHDAEALQHNATNVNAGDGPPLPEGLTPQQEQAASLLASGMAIQDVAERVGIHRSTLWHWRQRETFQAHLNALRSEAMQDALGRLLALQSDAFDAITRIMEDGSDAAALKAACYVLEQAADVHIGPTDPRTLLRAVYTTDELSHMIEGMDRTFDEQGYRKRCEELGIEP